VRRRVSYFRPPYCRDCVRISDLTRTTKTKNSWRDGSTDFRVQLIGRALDIVRRRIQAVESGYVFPSTGRRGHVEQKTVSAMVWMRQPFATTRPEHKRTRLPVTHWSVNDLRRTGRTQLTALGYHLDVAEAVIGYMPSGIGSVYNRYGYDQERRDWLTRLGDLYEKIQNLTAHM